MHTPPDQPSKGNGRRVLAAHLRTLAADCAADRDTTPLGDDQSPAEYMAAYSRIRAMDSSTYRLERAADRLAGDGA